VQLLARLEEGKGQEGDIEKILSICDQVAGKSFCTLADGFVACVTSAVKNFRSEFEAGYRLPAWELFPYQKSALFGQVIVAPPPGVTLSQEPPRPRRQRAARQEVKGA
jgi:NADH-quinone oxidoreductase subunit F